MTHPDSEALAALALGEPADESLSAHVTGCPTCSDDLAELRDMLSGMTAGPVPLAKPPASVWEGVRAEVDGSARETDDRPGRARRQVRGRSRTVWWAVAAGVVGLALGGLAGRQLAPAPAVATGDVVGRAYLDTLDTKVSRGEADLIRTGTALTLHVAAPALRTESGYLEVWLINKDLKRMVSVGVLRPGQEQDFGLTQELIDEGYVVVDISAEPLDANPAHSGDSLVRGILT